MCSEPLEEVGEVGGAAQVPQHMVEEADGVQHLGWANLNSQQFQQLVLFNLRLANMSTPLLVHLGVVESKESFPLLKVGRQCSVPNLPTSSQLSSLLIKEKVGGRL